MRPMEEADGGVCYARGVVGIEPDRLYRYEGIFRGFTAVMGIDSDGLVIDCETLFRRLPALR